MSNFSNQFNSIFPNEVSPPFQILLEDGTPALAVSVVVSDVIDDIVLGNFTSTILRDIVINTARNITLAPNAGDPVVWNFTSLGFGYLNGITQFQIIDTNGNGTFFGVDAVNGYTVAGTMVIDNVGNYYNASGQIVIANNGNITAYAGMNLAVGNFVDSNNINIFDQAHNYYDAAGNPVITFFGGFAIFTGELFTTKPIVLSNIANGNTGAVVVNGTTAVVINNTAVNANCFVRFHLITPSAIANVGQPYVSSQVNGTSFSVKSTNVADASTYRWELVNFQ